MRWRDPKGANLDLAEQHSAQYRDLPSCGVNGVKNGPFEALWLRIS
jgi:hypothetical protein